MGFQFVYNYNLSLINRSLLWAFRYGEEEKIKDINKMNDIIVLLDKKINLAKKEAK